MRDDHRPTVLLAATTWWPLSARLAMAFLRHGCRVVAVCPPGHPMRFVSGIENVHPYHGFHSLQSLKTAILSARPDVIVPCDDGVVWQLHQLHAEDAGLRPVIEYSLGPAEFYPTLRRRGAFLRAAAELGVRIPLAGIIASPDELDSWTSSKSAVLKLDGTWGGSGIEIAHSPAEALEAYHRLSRPYSAGVAWKRFFINSDPLAIWSWRTPHGPHVSVQQFIPGRPANAMFACWRGEVLAIVIAEVLCAQGATGAATVIRLVWNEEIAQAARLIARRFMLSGFHGLDFVMEQHTNTPYLIEINPRCTQLGHLRLPGRGDLAGIFAARIRNEPAPAEEDPIDGHTIAFFPQALLWNPKSRFLRHGYHDVPWEEPALFHELLRKSWPERRPIARLYHSFRNPVRPEEVNFDELVPEQTVS